MENFWKKEESNIEIQNIEILNNGKIEKSKLFLLEIEDEINLKIEIENMVYFSKSDNIFDSVVELRKKLELKKDKKIITGNKQKKYTKKTESI